MYYGMMTSRRDTRRILCEENSANIFLNTNRTNLTLSHRGSSTSMASMFKKTSCSKSNVFMSFYKKYLTCIDN